MNRRPIRFLLASVALPVTLAAQAGSTGTHASVPRPNTPASKAYETITFTDFAFDVPAELPAGMITFRAVNKGKQLHHGTLIRLDSNRTVADLLTAMQKPGPIPGWAKFYGGPQNASTVTMDLPAGNYVWICVIPGADGVPHFAKGMVRPMKVLPSKGGSAAPKADIVVTMSDYAWAMSRPITRGAHVLRVADTPNSQPHELVIVRLPPGVTSAEIADWTAHPEKLANSQRDVEGVTVIDPGLSIYTSINFVPGHYMLVCFVPDRKDGKPHAAHGMVKELTVQ